MAACASAPGDGTAAEPTATATSLLDSPAPSTSGASVSPSVSPRPTREIIVAVTGGVITPPPADIGVSIGERLLVVVTSDTPDEVHVHGVDVSGPVGPGAPFQAEVMPTQTGSFEVELHESDALLFRLLVR